MLKQSLTDIFVAGLGYLCQYHKTNIA